MTNKFEQLIEYVINDDEAKAHELFHEIVVEKSRQIYENLMNEEDGEECDHCHKPMPDCVCEDLEETALGGDPADELIQGVETEETGMTEDDDVEFDDKAEEDGEELTHDMEKDHDHDDSASEEDLEDRVVDLEDKLDELMAEFEAMMDNGEEEVDSVNDIDGGDALGMDDTDTAEFDDEAMMENVKLDAAPKPVTAEQGNGKAGPVAFNSGARGMQGAPVKMTGDTAQGRSAPKSGDLPEAGQFKNVPGKGGSNAKLSPATKPVTSQPAGINTRTPFPKG